MRPNQTHPAIKPESRQAPSLTFELARERAALSPQRVAFVAEIGAPEPVREAAFSGRRLQRDRALHQRMGAIWVYR